MYWALYYSKIKRQITMYKIYISYTEWLAKCKNLFVNIIFQKLLKKLISKSPQLAPHMYIHVSCEPRFHFTVFLFFVFFKLECRDFTWSTTNFTFHQSSRSQIKLLYTWQRLHMPEWKALNVRGCGSGPKPKHLWQWIQCSMSLRLQSFYRTDINIRAIYQGFQ